MTRAEKAEKIRKLLNAEYPAPPVPLDHHDAYTLLVSVLLSAQCTDVRVNTVTPALFRLAGTPQEMMHVSVADIKAIIRPCGLSPQKSKAIHTLSGMLVNQFGGEVPDNFEDLETLPGVGHKTAGVVMTQAFGHPAFPVDTHIHRLGARWGLSDGHSVEKTERDLKVLFAEETWGKVHLQMIFFGREHCPARGHDLSTCPICSWAATKKRIKEETRKR
ncbi:MAG: endonuclease-3 [Myxococcota bacterium]|jgi:endonuclease-3